jgi:hypothetical protein
MLSKNKESLNTVKFAYIYKKLYIYNIRSIEMYLFSLIKSVFDDKIHKISQKGTPTSTGTNKIIGPIYVCLSQSPYIKMFDEQMVARSDIVNHKKAYYTEEKIKGNTLITQETTSKDGNFSSLYGEMIVIFPNYSMTLDLETGMEYFKYTGNYEKFFPSLNTLVVNETLCYLKCNKGTLNCGCLNATSQDMDYKDKSNNIYIDSELLTDSSDGQSKYKSIKQYDSKCVNNNNVQTNYSIMYYLNPYSSFNSYIINPNRGTELVS